MWRQVELTVIQGRNLGNARPFETSGDASSELDGVDLGVSCEIHLNDILCGRTTVKKGIGSLDWHENFTFSDLPPFESIDLLVWQEKKLFRPVVLGSVRIPLINFCRGEVIEGWFPVLCNGSIAGDIQVGELRLKMRIVESVSPPPSYISLTYQHLERLFSHIRLMRAFSRSSILLSLPYYPLTVTVLLDIEVP